ncbi:HlyD family efflux transporter periplasmic adaptor subunit [uncultured Friedmanniella sp.]|uniref:HlyD family efflux transporter periplasmic adaptor subunit n=1 Tax=uncultured Friedmanniella sp. TaxID=335381 RepID=UPI0035CB5CA6
MTWTNRLRLSAGLLAVIALVAALTVVFNQRQHQAQSLTATVSTNSYDVGAGYGGTVVKQYVEENDIVAVGDKLFTMQSPALSQDVANKVKVTSTEAYNVSTKKGTITYKATVAGQVEQLGARLGTTLTGGQPFAKITVTGSQFVQAQFLLTPRDYERVQVGAAVSILLPDNDKVEGTVSTIKVSTQQGNAAADIRVDSPDLADPDLSTLTRTGTPVVATVQLRDDGPLAGTHDAAFAFLRQIGLQ